MQRYAHGDAGAFEVLYHRHKGPLYRYVLRGVGNRATADELYQDIWLRLIQARNGYQPRARFSTWLFTLAHNRVVDHYRRSRPTAHEIPEQTAPRHEQPEEQ
ncbi:MAG: sigma-70 family RNA polymerase sigma factor, partial [Salinisphaera sp.]|nr:sigma-70 family RNA polymerase sigma factor [Salinisphaera sp.]